MGQAKSKATSPESAGAQPEHRTMLAVMREWSDALVIAFLLAMFIRTFVVELFKIPSGSMTPTLIGSGRAESGEPRELVMEWDVDKNGEKDLIIDNLGNPVRRYHIFYRREGKFVGNKETDELPITPPELLRAQKTARVRNDRIIVNKFICWFCRPRRGEIIVFRVPESIWDRDKPIYIKRCVGLPGDLLEIRSPHVFINGHMLDEPEVFRFNEYVNNCAIGDIDPDKRPSYIKWRSVSEGFTRWNWFESASVPPAHYFMLGDNSRNSHDSRVWGAVPEKNIKGKAVFRYWPLDTIGFLD